PTPCFVVFQDLKAGVVDVNDDDVGIAGFRGRTNPRVVGAGFEPFEGASVPSDNEENGGHGGGDDRTADERLAGLSEKSHRKRSAISHQHSGKACWEERVQRFGAWREARK